MVRPSGRRGNDDVGPVTDMTGRVEGRIVTASSGGVRGRYSSSDLPATPTHLAPGFHHGTGEPRSSAQPPAIPFRSRPPLQLHLSHTPVPYEPYGSAQPSSYPTDTVYDPYLHALIIRPRIPYRSATQKPILEFIDVWRCPSDFSCSTHGYSHAEYGVSSSVPYVPSPADRVCEGDIGFEGSRNKRPEVAREVPAPTQKGKKVKPSDWEQTEPAEGGPVNPELIPSYGGYVAGPIWRGQDRGSLKFRLRYMELTGWELTDALTSLWPRVRAACYLQYILCSLLFSDKSGNIVPTRLWSLLQDASSVGRSLGQTSRVDAKELAGCWSLLEFGYRQCIPAHPIHPQVARRPPNNRMYVLRNTFVEALWLKAPSHLLIETWTSVPAIPSSSCTDDYMGWYLPHSHLRIQNPGNIPNGFHLPVVPIMPPQALLDLIAREVNREDLQDSEIGCTVRDLLRKHYRAP
ncbi:hypothetical protein M9H77_03699 [Catharanthus roseus]|uniref:Uncharacterized protein n=1 Tax=Catharanthus roseus TaxID=4058 RepID=A0ACC0CC27_CATRO|nr:hypothetical protein M9H77_03699 [Catharanthus roseus]